MTNNYISTSRVWLFSLGLLINQILFAQTASVPTIQWQKLLSGPTKQTASGDFLVASGTVIRLTSDGSQKWATSLATYSADNILPLANGNSAVLAHDSYYFYKWAIILLDPTGTIISTQPFANYTSPNGGYPQLYLLDIVQAPDGGFAVLGNIAFGREGNGTTLYKFDSNGSLNKTASVEAPLPPGQFRPSTYASRVLPLPDGYLVAGSSYGQAWAAKLNPNLEVVWTDRYDFAVTFTDIIPNPFNPQAFIATGISADRTGTITLVVSPTQTSVNNTGGTFRPSLQAVTFNNYPYDGSVTTYSLVPKIVSSNATSYVVLDGVDQRSGDIRVTSFGAANQTRWTKVLGGAAADLITSAIATQDGGYLLAGLTQSNDGDVQGKTGGNVTGWLVKLAPGTSLALSQPSYNCDQGTITFNTSGGDGTPITFSAPGIARSSATNATGVVEPGLRNDPKPILITATQSGYSTSYNFDLKAACSGTTPTPPPTGGPLTLTQPTYDCVSGAITFNTTGGNGTPVTYSAPGIMRSSVTSNTGTVEPGLRNDPKTLLITAMQSGQTTTYSFDFNAFCSATPPTPTPPGTPPTPPTTGSTLTLTQPTYNCTNGVITFNSTGGDGTPITYSAPGIMRAFVTSSTGTVEPGLRNDPKTLLITAMQSGRTTTYSFDFNAFCTGTTPVPPSTLKLLAPVVDCSTRRITLTTSGGDGSAISFTTPNITRGSETSPLGTVDYCVGNQPLTLRATQSGYTAVYEGFDFTNVCPTAVVYKPLTAIQVPDLTVVVNAGFSYIFSNYFADPTTAPAYQPSFTFQATGLPAALTFTPQQNVSTNSPAFRLYGILSDPAVYTITVSASNGCLPAASTTFKLTVNPASGTTPLTLVAPTYNCATGAITFNYTGGTSSPVEFQAAGITGWTTNPNQFIDKDSRTAADVKPFTLMARQNGQLVTYTWDLKAACGRSGRLAATEANQLMEVRVKGNPVGATAIIEISGTDGQPVQLELLNASGQVLEQRSIEQTRAVDEQRFDLQHQPSGLLLLRAQSGQQRQTVKLIKQ